MFFVFFMVHLSTAHQWLYVKILKRHILMCTLTLECLLYQIIKFLVICSSQECLESVGFHPEHLRSEMISQLQKRPSWCISRQREWGVPLPVFYCKDSGKPLLNRSVTFEKRGCHKWGWWHGVVTYRVLRLPCFHTRNPCILSAASFLYFSCVFALLCSPRNN